MKNLAKPNLLALSIGLVYLWFGTLKFFPSLSLAENLAKNTLHELSFGLFPDTFSIISLAILEVGIGIFLILNIYRKVVVGAALFHMVFTFAPLVLFPSESFKELPFVPTLLGQYIGKNFVIMAALISLSKKEKT